MKVNRTNEQMPPQAEREGKWTKLTFCLSALHIYTLCSLAIAKPLFDVTAKNAAFYVVRGSKPVDILTLIFVLSVLIPSAVVAMEGVLRLFGRKIQRIGHVIFVGLLIALYASQFLKLIDGINGLLSVAMTLSLGISGVLLYLFTRQFRLLLSIVSPIVLLFPMLFIFGSQVGKIVIPADSRQEHVNAITLKQQPPIVFVLMDELPVVSLLDARGNIDAKRFPNLAEFAKTAYWFRYATAVAASTENAVPAILSGIFPTKKLLPTMSDHPDNLFTLLRNSYKFHVLESATYLCPKELSSGEEMQYSERIKSLFADMTVVYLHIILPFDYTKQLPSISNRWGGFIGTSSQKRSDEMASSKDALNKRIFEIKTGDRVASFRKFISKIDADKESLHFVHLMLPHGPFEYLPSCKRYPAKSELGIEGILKKDDKFLGPQGLVTQYHQLHLLQMSCADRLFGELLDHLREIKLFDDALIILVADHGASFSTNDFNRRVSEKNSADIMFVPLLIKQPKQSEGIVSGIEAETVDIMPTIAYILGIKLPWKATGQSLFASERNTSSAKSILNDNGVILSFPYRDLINSREKSLAKNVHYFGLNDEDSNLFWFDKQSRHLMDKSVSEFEVREGTDIIQLRQSPNLFSNIDLRNNFLPASINGRLTAKGTREKNPEVVISINGVIKAVANTYLVDGKYLFSAVVPEDSFKQGKNDLKFFILSLDNNRQTVLVSTVDAEQTYSLEQSVIKSSKDELFKILPGNIQGSVDSIKEKDSNMYIEGWAADIKNSRRVDSVLVFADGKFVHSQWTNKARPDVSKAFKDPSIEKSGFSFFIPLNSIRDSRTFRFFALSGGMASEIANPLKLQDQPKISIWQCLKKLFSHKDSYSLKNNFIMSSSGKTFPIGPKSIKGSVDILENKNNHVIIAGWAADVEKSHLVDTVIIFEGDKFITAGPTTESRPDVSVAFNNETITQSGFKFILPSTSINDLNNIRIFVISNNAASQLR